MHKSEVIIYWNQEDKAFIAEVPELPGCMAHGDAQEAALENVNQAMELWLDTACEFGDPIPEPKGNRLSYARCTDTSLNWDAQLYCAKRRLFSHHRTRRTNF
jgi:predicted RNase H-like HicB family nuclease